MEFTAQSEYHTLDSVFLKPVMQAFIDDFTLSNEWESLNYLAKPDFKMAVKEYKAFESLLIQLGCKTTNFPKDDKVTIDAIYCRDASIVTDYGVVLCNMGKAERSLEPKAQESMYRKQNINILGSIEAPGTLEGGDVAWLNKNTLAVGQTYRTNAEGIRQLERLLTPLGIEIIIVNLPHYKGPLDVFHLMSILSPVDKDLAVVYSPLMPIRFRNRLLEMGYEFVEVAEEEFESMGCNVLAVAPRKCIMVQGNPKTEEALRRAGCQVFTYSGNEISIKGGGGPTCLTRPMLRRL
ncbi:dimethylarginine dimethylaminohydrolase family protein [Spongiimicrobium sp. 3-5]|uniref:dimethylarginine dimethylaminohydrolase family protein n=1 Tax=Spongiimicrobium sp. 3-5 TaxID=3332596 RepID=UPI00397EFCA9